MHTCLILCAIVHYAYTCVHYICISYILYNNEHMSIIIYHILIYSNNKPRAYIFPSLYSTNAYHTNTVHICTYAMLTLPHKQIGQVPIPVLSNYLLCNCQARTLYLINPTPIIPPIAAPRARQGRTIFHIVVLLR